MQKIGRDRWRTAIPAKCHGGKGVSTQEERLRERKVRLLAARGEEHHAADAS